MNFAAATAVPRNARNLCDSIVLLQSMSLADFSVALEKSHRVGRLALQL